MAVTKTDICNITLDLIRKDDTDDITTDTRPIAKQIVRNYDFVLRRCLRRSPWPWAIKRVPLSTSLPAPVNEFTKGYDLPTDYLKFVELFPRDTRYKIERGRILSDESSLTLRYVTNEALTDPTVMDPMFIDYFAHELALRVVNKASDSSDLKASLKEDRDEAFRIAAAIFSQEEREDALPESPWISERIGSNLDDGTILISGLET